MDNITVFSIISVVNIFLLLFGTFNLFKRKHIVDLLISVAVLSLIVLEISRFSMLLGFNVTSKAMGLGFCLTLLFWLIATIAILPPKSYSFSRVVLSPLFGFLALIFFLVWWIHPFILTENTLMGVELSNLARYFFVLVVLGISLVLSNLERSFYFTKQKNLRLLMISALFFLGSYILFGVYAVVFSRISTTIFAYSSIGTLLGGLIFLFASKDDLAVESEKEETAVHTSLILFLMGGYLFFIGIFIKLFQVFGWNLNTFFSFLTTILVFFIFFFLVFSTSFKERIKNFLLRYFTRQKYDWQKIWEDFTYKISLVTDIEKIKTHIEEAVLSLIGASEVRVFMFDKGAPFEEGFSDWLLRQAQVFNVNEIFNSGLNNKFPTAESFFRNNKIEMASPLYGEKKIIGIIGIKFNKDKFVDKELLKLLSLQASGVILNCWANQALREAEKKESIHKVSSFVIHDVKNYINNLSLLIANKDKFNDPEFQEDALFTLENTIRKMKQLMEEFKTLRGDIQVYKREHKLCDILNEVLRDLSKDNFKNVELVMDLDSSVEVNVDAKGIHKVILNMIINALDAMENGGKIMISISSFGKYGYISIEDTGSGMARDFIENRLFKPFSSTKAKGLGIGLYQCKTIIDVHGGKVEVDSEVGQGTKFKILLPTK